MNTTTDLTRLSAENAGVAVVAVSTLGPDAGRQIGGTVASIDSSTEGRSASPARKVQADVRRLRGIPELDSPMAG